MKLTIVDEQLNEKTYELRGGAWLDEANQCFYNVICPLGVNGYYLCKEIGTNKEFALYLPNYYGELELPKEWLD